MCWNSRIATVLVFPKLFAFWLAESGLFAQKAVVSNKGRNPNILNVLEIENCNSFSFSQVVDLNKNPKYAGNFSKVFSLLY